MKPENLSPYLGWIKSLPCCNCGAPPPSEAAHIIGPVSFKTGLVLPRRRDHAHKFAVPLCPKCHRTGKHSIHAVGEERFFLAFGRGEGYGPRLGATYLAVYVHQHERNGMAIPTF